MISSRDDTRNKLLKEKINNYLEKNPDKNPIPDVVISAFPSRKQQAEVAESWGWFTHPKNPTMMVEYGKLEKTTQESGNNVVKFNGIEIKYHENFVGFIKPPFNPDSIQECQLYSSGNRDLNFDSDKYQLYQSVPVDISLTTETGEAIDQQIRQEINDQTKSVEKSRYFYPNFPKYMPIYYLAASTASTDTRSLKQAYTISPIDSLSEGSVIGNFKIRVLNDSDTENNHAPSPFYDIETGLSQIFYRPGSKVLFKNHHPIKGAHWSETQDIIGHTYVDNVGSVKYFLQVTDQCVSHNDVIICEPPPPHINPLSKYQPTDGASLSSDFASSGGSTRTPNGINIHNHIYSGDSRDPHDTSQSSERRKRRDDDEYSVYMIDDKEKSKKEEKTDKTDKKDESETSDKTDSKSEKKDEKEGEKTDKKDEKVGENTDKKDEKVGENTDKKDKTDGSEKKDEKEGDTSNTTTQDKEKESTEESKNQEKEKTSEEKTIETEIDREQKKEQEEEEDDNVMTDLELKNLDSLVDDQDNAKTGEEIDREDSIGEEEEELLITEEISEMEEIEVE